MSTRSSLEFLVRWSNFEETSEPSDQDKKLTEVDEYIHRHPEVSSLSPYPFGEGLGEVR